MKVYLARFSKNDKVAYKVGLTKYFKAIKRFEDQQYDIFDDIVILDDIYIESKDYATARLCCELVEATLKGVFPKDFRLEEYFMTEDNTFDNLSGITEMFLFDYPEEILLETFAKVKRNVGFVMRNYNGK